ncbi:hypothetical protein D3C86_2046590 [compost metagenome]
MIGILTSECFAINSCKSCKSRGVFTNESAIQSTFCSIAKIASAISFSVKAGKEIFVFGRLTPFLDFNSPP